MTGVMKSDHWLWLVQGKLSHADSSESSVRGGGGWCWALLREEGEPGKRAEAVSLQERG